MSPPASLADQRWTSGNTTPSMPTAFILARTASASAWLLKGPT